LDTNIWVAVANDEPGLIKKLRQLDPAEIVSCSIVRAELLFGARKSQRVHQNVAAVDLLLGPFLSLPFDDRAAEQYGLLRATLERAGTPIGNNDLLIASIALANDCCLVTRNTREFARVPGLRLQSWP
jgi:tRNA(fMet)-specific endonuclease VapC